ncbi:hypothetical protein ACVWWO_000207 [Bradyrhizobium sp. F1.13.1]
MACSIAELSDDDISHGSQRACMIGQPLDELVRSVSDHLLTTNIWIGEGELDFPEAYGEELEVLGPVRVGRGYRFSFSYSVTDIEILADLTP